MLEAIVSLCEGLVEREMQNSDERSWAGEVRMGAEGNECLSEAIPPNSSPARKGRLSRNHSDGENLVLESVFPDVDKSSGLLLKSRSAFDCAAVSWTLCI
jgi:hypothetical protein